jgi:hypothetical protein
MKCETFSAVSAGRSALQEERGLAASVATEAARDLRHAARIAVNAPGGATPCATEEDVIVLGLRRSGIHAIISWLIPQLEGTTRLVNDHDFRFGPEVDPIEGAPTLYFQSRQGAATEIVPASVFSSAASRCVVSGADEFLRASPWFLRPLVRSVLRKYRRHLRGRTLRAEAIPFPPELLMRAAHRNVFVFENLPVGEFAECYPRWRAEVYAPFLAARGLRPAPSVRIVQVLREPWNQLASVLKNAPLSPPRPVRPEAFRAAWIEHAREFASAEPGLARFGEVTRIAYPRWFGDAEHRAGLAVGMGLVPNETGASVVARFGGGSSFEGQAMSGRAAEMKVHERWRAYAEHPLMRALCADPEVRELSRAIFGASPPA